MNLDIQVRRLEQQLAAFAELHANELEKFAQTLAAYKQLQADEVRMLREQLDALKAKVEVLDEQSAGRP